MMHLGGESKPRKHWSPAVRVHPLSLAMEILLFSPEDFLRRQNVLMCLIKSQDLAILNACREGFPVYGWVRLFFILFAALQYCINEKLYCCLRMFCFLVVNCFGGYAEQQPRKQGRRKKERKSFNSKKDQKWKDPNVK